MRQWCTLFVAGGCLLYLLCFCAAGQGQRLGEKTKLSRENCVDTSAILEVTSERMTFDQQTRTFTFDGKVRVHRCDMIMTCDRLHVVNDAKGEQVERVTAVGDVHFQRGTRHVIAERAEFSPAEQRLVLTGTPRAWDTQEQQEMTGEEMIVFLHDENMLVKRARALFHPRKVVSKVP
jgi:lipopolysaccharide export system protein LptA